MAPEALGGGATGVARVLRRLPGLSMGLLIVIWVGLPLVPEATGLKFGMVYRIFFTVMLGLAVSFFWLLGRK